MSESHQHDRDHDSHEHVERLELGRIGFVGLAIVVTWLRLWQPLPHFDVIGFAAVLIGGYPIFREALTDLRILPESITHSPVKPITILG